MPLKRGIWNTYLPNLGKHSLDKWHLHGSIWDQLNTHGNKKNMLIQKHMLHHWYIFRYSSHGKTTPWNWELIFIYCGLFVLILESFFFVFFFVLFLLSLWFGQISPLAFFRWALWEDSGFKSYPSRPEVYLVKNVVR